MSAYLTRLATRARESEEVHPLQPFVRSTSPIVEHDQRVGMTDFEGFERLGARPDSTRSESSVGHPGETRTQRRPDITRKTGGSETTLQRKMAAPSIGKLVHSPLAAPAGPPIANETINSGRQRSTLEMPAEKKSPLPGAMEPKSLVAPLEAESSAGVSDVPHQYQSLKPSAPHYTTPREPRSSSLTVRKLGNEPFVSSTESDREDAPGPDRLPTHDTHQQSSPVVVHTRSVRRGGEKGSPRLEPLAHAFPDRLQPLPVGAPEASAPANESPRIVIGRINVEVVPPAVHQVSAAPRPGPLTAASASVIGPLSSGIRPNVRLSLRYR